MSLLTTSSQTVGPYVKIGFEPFSVVELAPAGVTGERITLSGRVVDGDGKPVNDAVVEIWQANAQGKYAHPEDAQDKPIEAGFRGFGRCLTDAKGSYRFTTVKPGRVPGPGGALQAPHIVVTVFMRGLHAGDVHQAFLTPYIRDAVSADGQQILLADWPAVNAYLRTLFGGDLLP